MTYDRHKTSRHEGAHAAASILLGHLPRRVTADRPTEGYYGQLELAWGPDGVTPEGARLAALVVLCGPMVEQGGCGSEEWPPRWPLCVSDDGDAGQVGACVKYLKLDWHGWQELIKEAEALVAEPEFVRLVDLIARALELRDELDRADLRWLIGAERFGEYITNWEE